MPRSESAETTRAAILAAAHARFARFGFEPTTIRSVAADAGVDPALVMHYFGNKHGLFAEASRLDVQLPDLTGVDPDRVADRLVPVFGRLWGPGGPLLPLLRAASTSPTAADALLSIFDDTVAPALSAVAIDGDRRRAAMIGAHLLGVAVSRSVVGTAPLRDMDDAELAEWLGPVVAYYLTTTLP